MIIKLDSKYGKEFEKAAGNANYLDPDGGEFTFVFVEAGEYTYFCAPHPWMRGTVTVVEPAA